MKAIDNNQFATWPGLTSSIVHQHLPKSPATDKGHLKWLRQNIWSTKPNRTKREEEITTMISQHNDIYPKWEYFQEENKTNFFCFAAIADMIEGTIYTNNTGKFPVRSIENVIYIFLLYNFNSNAILVKTLKTLDTKHSSQHSKNHLIISPRKVSAQSSMSLTTLSQNPSHNSLKKKT